MNLKHLVFLLFISWFFSACAETPSKSSSKSSTGTATANSKEGDGPLETFMQGCKTELESYCKGVTPGEGRILACIYAHEDKISGRCEYAMYDSASQLERAVAALSYVVNECGDDLEKYCAAVEAGEGRLLACLEQHDKKVSGRCKQALKDTQLEE